MDGNEDDSPMEHGSQTTPERPTPPAGEGRSVVQVIVIGIAVLVVLAGLLWLLVPLIGA